MVGARIDFELCPTTIAVRTDSEQCAVDADRHAVDGDRCGA